MADFSTEGLSNVGFTSREILFRKELLGVWECAKLLSYDTLQHISNLKMFPKENDSVSEYPSEIPKSITFFKTNKWCKIVDDNRFSGYMIDKNGYVAKGKRGNLLEKIIAYHPNSANMGYPEISYPLFWNKDSVNGYAMGHLIGDFWHGGFDYLITKMSNDSMMISTQGNQYLYLKKYCKEK
jgi:hypothetical protein